MAKPTAAQVKAQLLKTQAANQAKGNQPTAETLNKRAARQADRAELTTSQQQMQNKAFATKTAKEDAIRKQAQAQVSQPATGTDYRNAMMNSGGYGVSQGSKIARTEWMQGAEDQYNYDVAQWKSQGSESRKIEDTEMIQGYTDQYKYDVEQAKRASLGHAGQDAKTFNAESIENQARPVITARGSMGGTGGATPSGFSPTPSDPTYLAAGRYNPSANLEKAADAGALPVFATQQELQKQLEEKSKDSLPFGALSMIKDAKGNDVPYYGTGLKSWIRRTWADLADPKKYQYDLYELTPDEQKKVTDNYAANIADSAAILNERLKWDEWGKNLFGLSAEEVATFTSARGLETDIAEQTGQSLIGMTGSRFVRLGIDTTQNLIWGGLDLLGLDDTTARKSMALRVGIDAVADKYNKDEDTNFFSKALNSGNATPIVSIIAGPLGAVYNMFGVAKDIITVAQNGALAEINPFANGKAGSVAIPPGTSPEEAKKLMAEYEKKGTAQSTVNKYLAGSVMAYSMVYDEMARSQFEKGIAEGRDPGELAQQYGNTGIELAGSILGSPSTYLGLTLKAPAIFSKAGRAEGLVKSLTTWKTVVSVPTFGEIFGLGVGKARLAASASRFDGIAKEFAPVVELLQAAQKAPDAQVASKLDEIVKITAETFDNQRKFRGNLLANFASYDSAGKISVASRDANLFIGSLTGSEGVSGTLEILSDMIRARKGGEEAVRATERLLSRTDAGVFSEVGNMVGEIMSRLDDVDLLEITKKYAGSPEVSKLHAEVMGKVESVLEEFIPSVDDMLKAKKALAAGDNSARVVQLAKMADDLPLSVRVIRGVTKIPQKFAQIQSGYMVQSFMALMPRSTAKNVWGQIVPIAFQTGLSSALKITADSLLGGLNQTVLGKIAKSDNLIGKGAEALTFEKLVANKIDKINELVGFLPGNEAGIEKALTKSDFLGGMLKNITGGFLEGQLPKMGRMEELASLGIIESMLKQEIQKALPAVIKDLPEYDSFMKTLPAEQRGLFTHLLDTNAGNWDNAVNDLRSLTAKGDIEAWRVTPLSPNLRKELDRMGFLDTFNNVQRNVDEPEKLTQFIDDFETKYREAIEAEAKNLPSTMQKPPEGEQEFFEMLELRPGRQNDYIRELYQSAQNMRDKLDEVTYSAKNNLQRKIDELGKQLEADPNQAQALLPEIQKANAARGNLDVQLRAIEKEIKAPQERLNLVLEQTKKWYFDMYQKQGGTFTPEQMTSIWNKKITLGKTEGYRLADIFPQVKAEELTPEALVDLMWNAQRNDRADKWWFYNNKKYTNTMNALEQTAAQLGTTLDEVALMDKSPTNPYFELQKLNAKYEAAEEMFSWQRYLDQFTATPDVPLSKLAGDAKGRQLNQEYITRIVNNAQQPIADVAKNSPRKANPLAYLKKNGGINPEEFKNIFGEANSANVMPGLLKKNADAIDAVGVRLWEGGFITKEQADDYEYIRDYLRGFEKGVDLTDEQIAAKEAQYLVDNVIPYEEITLSQAREALQNLKFVPSYDGGQITEARVAFEGMDNFIADVRKWEDKVVGEWGKTVKTTYLQDEDAMRSAQKAYEARMKVVRRKAAVVSVSTRNFALHDYNKTYMDHALTMMLGNSLHYWSTRSYMRSIETMVDNPKIANMYMAYKEYMTKEHSDMPEWYRYNIDVGALMGIDSNNQYFINLESAINPMNGLTGVDFDDPYKRVDWASRMIADIGKMGVGVSPLYQWALALKLNEQGKTEAAQRWAGRLLPFSQTVKSVTSGLDNVLGKFGVDTQPIEIDPFVLAFGEGKTISERMLNSVDPYEKNKVVAALAMMVDDGQISEEQMIEAARAKSGDIWQAAMERASDARAGGDVQAFFLGSAMKPRTADDMKIEKFWQDYGMLQSARSQMTPDEYRQAFTQMHDNPEYGSFVDGLLLSRKSGDAMETAYTYNVLGRIPPGQMESIAEIVGLDTDMIRLFYSVKGDFSQMGLSESDMMAFQGAIADIAATYTIPSTATKQEWNYATSLYGQMRDTIAQEFGADIHEKIGVYYGLTTSERKKYIENNPEVQAAMDRQTEFITNTPTLMEYYGSMNTLEMNYSNQTRAQLEKKYSSSVINDASMLYDKNTSAEQRDAIFREYSPLRQYQYEYGNAKETAAQQLAGKYSNIQEGYDLLNSPESILPDGKTNYAYVNKIKSQYKIKQYESELRTLTKKLEAEINASVDPQIIVDARLYNKVDEDAKLAIEAKYSELEAYLNERSELYDQNLQDIIDYGGYLPEAPTAEVRPEADPNGDAQQQDLYDLAMNPVPEKTFEDWTVEIGTPAAELIQFAYDNGENVDYEAMKQLRREADRLGYRDEYDLLQAILMSLK